MTNTNIPFDLRIISNDNIVAHIKWNLQQKNGFVTEIHSSSSQNGTYELEKTVREELFYATISGGFSRYIKLRTRDLLTDELSVFGNPKLIVLGGGSEFDENTELESLGSSLHRSVNFSAAALDDGGDWVDVGSFNDLSNFRKLHSLKYSVTGGTPVNLLFRIVEQTSEMNDFAEKLEPQELLETATEELAIFDPLVQIQKGSSIKLQVKCDSGGANGSSLVVDKLEYLDYTLKGF